MQAPPMLPPPPTAPRPRAAARRPGAWPLAAIASAGVLLALISTVWGVGTTPDSATYVSAAQNLRAGQGLRVQSDIHQSQEYYTTGRFPGSATPAGPAADPAGVVALPLTQYPPLFSVLLALGGLLAGDALNSARWLNALLFVANILLTGGVIQRTARGASGAARAGALLMLVAPDMLTIHVMAWSEPLFIFCALAGIAGTVHYLDTDRRSALIAAAAAIALASVTRYVGVVLIVTGLAGIGGLSRKPRRGRMIDAALFTLIAGLPLAAWLLRNMTVAGSFANRESVWHPVTGPALAQAVTTVGTWLLPLAVPDPLPVAGTAILLVLGLVGGSLWGLRGPTRTASSAAAGESQPAAASVLRLSALLGLFIGLYLGFLLVTISFYDAATPLDGRILSPIFVALLILVLVQIQWHFGPQFGARRVRGPALALAALFIGLYAASSLPQVLQNYQAGINYTSREWRQSAIIRRLRAVPSDTLVYSNGPDAIY